LAVTLRAGKGQLLRLDAPARQQHQQKKEVCRSETKMDYAVRHNGIHGNNLPQKIRLSPRCFGRGAISFGRRALTMIEA
jgi:hypothetical protein